MRRRWKANRRHFEYCETEKIDPLDVNRSITAPLSKMKIDDPKLHDKVVLPRLKEVLADIYRRGDISRSMIRRFIREAKGITPINNGVYWSVQLPVELKEPVKTAAADKGFPSIKAYLADLVRRDIALYCHIEVRK